MALSETHRTSLYESLSPVVGQEEAQALLMQFPRHEREEPASREFVHAEVAGLRADCAEMRSELKVDIATLRTDLTADIGSVRSELNLMFRRQTVWLCGFLVGFLAAVAGLVTALR